MNKTLATLVASGVFLVGCSSQQIISPADIPPVYKIRNSPIPVPDPKWKPGQRSLAQKSKLKAAQRSVSSPHKKPVTSATSTRRHTVRKSETLYGLSKRYGIPVRSLISENKLRPPYTLLVGQRILVPVARVHFVKKGETGYGISRQYGVTASALMAANGIKPPYRLAVGQKLKLPGGARINSATATTVNSQKPKTTSRRSNTNKGRTIALPKPPPRSNKGFTWPVQGKLASRFGPREGGLHNDGINILAKKGAAVKVAEAGIVVYASNALEGYGNLLLVKHAGGWITAYAHTERILVRPGQRVKRGDVVARVGSTGGVVSPQLHFEIRKGRQALNPLRYLPPSRTSKS